MGILSSELNFNQVFNDLADCCKGTKECGECQGEKCLVGYSKECLKGCLSNSVTYVEDGLKNIPLEDSRKFDKENMIKGIAHILKQCRSCNEEHYKNCIINVLRSCYEKALFGEMQEYRGSAYKYLNEVHHISQETAEQIMEKYSE